MHHPVTYSRGVLVERTVKEVKPAVVQNKEKIAQVGNSTLKHHTHEDARDACFLYHSSVGRIGCDSGQG